jgi:sec-independent protein translocase protein TatC
MIKYLIEIKNRIFLVTLTYCSLFIITYYYKEILLILIIKSNYLFTNNKTNINHFIFTDVTEIFFLYFKLVFFISFQTTFFFFVYHTFIFFTYALFKKEYRFLRSLIQISLLTWCVSAYVSTNIIIPLTWDFFLSFQNLFSKPDIIKLHFEAKIVEYFNFYTSFYFMCELYFQSVIFIFFIFHYYNINFKIIRKFRKIFYFYFLILATFLTPDVISQIFLVALLIFAYEIFIFIFLIIKKLRNLFLIR